MLYRIIMKYFILTFFIIKMNYTNAHEAYNRLVMTSVYSILSILGMYWPRSSPTQSLSSLPFPDGDKVIVRGAHQVLVVAAEAGTVNHQLLQVSHRRESQTKRQLVLCIY